MIGLLIVGGITGLLALAAHKTNPSPAAGAPAVAAPATSSSAAHPANSGLEGIFSTPEMERLYSSATAARSYTAPAPAIPIQPGTRPAPASPTLRNPAVRLPSAPVAAKMAVLSPTPATATRISAPLRQQRFSLL